jgi:nicotinate-nucleotide pyrophosphorylase (carboxylating)
MTAWSFPDDPWLSTLIDQALAEDIGSGDVTTDITVSHRLHASALVVARQPGVICGLPLLEKVFGRLDASVAIELSVDDGSSLDAGQTAALMRGSAAALLSGERTVLNFLQHLSGIATMTARYAAAVKGTRCRILDTRKTLPGWRSLSKYAVRCGGGQNHRLGLHDRILIKDNHWCSADVAIADLVDRARLRYPALDIEIEVDSLEQFDLVLPLGIEWILLDNFTPDRASVAVKRRDGLNSSTLLEVSGNVTIETVRDFAGAGVDACSVGRLTHSAPALDLALDFFVDRA